MFKSGNGGSVDGIPALGADLALISGPTGMITTSVTTSLELSYLSGVTSSVQTQLNGKQPTGNYITALTGDVTAAGPGSVAATIGALKVTNGMLAGSIAQNKMSAVTASRALESDASGFYAVSVTTSVELGYLSGVTSSVQTQINSKMTNPMTTGGDVIYGGASGLPTRLVNGSAGQVLSSSGGTVAPVWTGSPTLLTPVVTNQIDLTGGQIKFPATQVASSDVNTLDDYEEGTFTPKITGLTTPGLATYSVQTGSYVKIGCLVRFSIYLAWTGHTGTGTMVVDDLPFSSVNTTNLVSAFSSYVNGMNSMTAGNILQIYLNINTTRISLEQYNPATAGSSVVPMDAGVAALIITGTYRTT